MVVENAIFVLAIVFLLFWIFRFRGGGSDGEEDMLSEVEKAERRRLALMRFGDGGEKKKNADVKSTSEKPKSMAVGAQSIVDAGERRRGALLRFRGNSSNCTAPAVDRGPSPRSIPATTKDQPKNDAEPQNRKRANLEDSTAKKKIKAGEEAGAEPQNRKRANLEDLTAKKKIKAGEEAATGNDIKAKPRDQRTPPPPAQLICEALSTVCGTDITVKPGKGPWGGEGWVKRKKSSARFSQNNSVRKLPKLTLPMLEQRRSGDSEWAQLESALESILESSSTALNPFSILISGIFKKGGISLAASLHFKTHGAAARDIVNDIVHPNVESRSTKEGLMRCLSVLKSHLAKTVAVWLDKDISTVSSQEEENDESDEEDLFSDDYNSESAKAERAARLLAALTNTALGEILELCSRPNATLVVTKQLLSDIVVHSSDGPRLAEGLLRRSLDRLPSPVSTKDVAFELFAKDSAVVTHLVANSQDVAMALSQLIKTEVGSASTGDEFEQSSVLRSLLSLGGYAFPSAGFERRQSSSSEGNGFRLYEALKTVQSFPLSCFDYGKKTDPPIAKVIDEASAIMGHARSFGSEIIRQIIRKKGGNGKDIFFSWLGRLAQANELQANLIAEQLLDGEDSVHQSLSSRPFLLGTALAVLEMCGQDLAKAYNKNGVDAFDPRYLMSPTGSLVNPLDERRLIGHDGSMGLPSNIRDIPRIYSGATEFFFLTSSLLRVSVHALQRTRNEYNRAYRSQEDRLVALAKGKNDTSRLVRDFDRRFATGLVGFSFLDDPETMGRLLDFSILQLRFLADLSAAGRDKEALLSLIPESIMKLPAQYVALVARSFQRLLSPHQAEAAVGHATTLLSNPDLSVQAQTELMRISGAFIEASVRREDAKQRRKLRPRRGGRTNEDDEVIIDKRELDIYSSLDRNDHGVVVFASPASTRLGPSLVNAFIAMEAVEGLDVEKDGATFYKNMVQSEISELLLRLWMHPSGAFRQSIAQMPAQVLNTFLKSVAAGICMEFDTVFKIVLDIRDVLENHRVGRSFSRQTMASLQSSYGRLPSFLGALRRLLLVLVYLSQEERVAAILGGASGESSAADMGIMIVSLLNKLTTSKGATHPLVDFRAALRRSSKSNTASGNGGRATDELLDARLFAINEFGFDCSSLAHCLLALATRWTVAAKKTGTRHALLDAITSHEDFDAGHFGEVYFRLVVAAQAAVGANDEGLIAQADGYVDPSIWAERYEAPSGIGLETTARKRRYSSQQDQLSHALSNGIMDRDQIHRFVDELGRLTKNVITQTLLMSPDEVADLERRVLENEQNTTLEDDAYCGLLRNWVVSSDTGMTGHFYEPHAKKSLLGQILGKVLLRDARRLWKDLPNPHPNASIYVCYAEERMDICRSMIVGATGTPYAGGLFLFDVCYPQLYPNAAPMCHFMTTGGGQVRFSPNLYNDGKVCLSLLGTTSAGDQSQRWNPSSSSLAQVLLSIQSQILDVAEPYFAEGGGHGGLQGTAAGRAGSARYNNEIRLSTLRHAINDQLRSPPKGFEDVVRRHFATFRRRLLIQAKVWCLEARGTELHGRFERAYSELVVLLSGDKLACEQWEEAEIGGRTFGALPPLADDLEVLQHLDKKWYESFESELKQKDSSEQDQESGAPVDDEELNERMLARAIELSLLERN